MSSGVHVIVEILIRIKDNICNYYKDIIDIIMSNKSKTLDSANKSKASESVWKKAFVSGTEWPDKVSLNRVTITIFFNEKLI